MKVPMELIIILTRILPLRLLITVTVTRLLIVVLGSGLYFLQLEYSGCCLPTGPVLTHCLVSGVGQWLKPGLWLIW
jgi:hypothetical protein